MATSAASAPVTSAGPGARRATHSGEPLALAPERLAHKAHEEGLEILPEPWEPFACRVTSSRPGYFPYVVNLTPGHLHGCDCEGYFRWQRCKHYALALEAAGWLPDVELDGDELDDQGLWEAAVAIAPSHLGSPSPAPVVPVSLMSRADRRAAAATDLAVRQGQAVAS
jgi:hypothetical protein